MVINVKEFGATADGVTLDTKAVQKAVDACAENGSGEVVFPAGTYLLGKVILKSNVTVTVHSGAKIVASPELEDYPVSKGTKGSLLPHDEDYDECPYDVPPYDKEHPVDTFPTNRRAAVFYACDEENVCIRGKGVIDGNYISVMEPYEKNVPIWADSTPDYKLYKPKGMSRPFIVYLENCENSVIEDVLISGASLYAVHCRRCTRLRIRGITIKNDIGADNADGIHLCSCTDTTVTNCDLTCGDDAIAIDGNDGKTSERVIVSECTIESRNNAIRVFTGLLTPYEYGKEYPASCVKNITISNCAIRQADCVISVNADCGEVSSVRVSNIVGSLTNCGTAFLISAHNNSKAKRISFDNWTITSRSAGYAYAEEGSEISEVDMRGLDILVCPKTTMYGCGLKEIPKNRDGVMKDLPNYWLYHLMPYFMQLVNVKNVYLDAVRIDWGEEDLSLLNEMTSDEGKAFIQEMMELRGWPEVDVTYDWSAILVENSENVEFGKMFLKPHGKCKETITVR